MEARLLRIKIKDELQTVYTPVFNRNHGLQVHPFFEVNPYHGRRLKRRRLREAFTQYTLRIPPSQRQLP